MKQFFQTKWLALALLLCAPLAAWADDDEESETTTETLDLSSLTTVANSDYGTITSNEDGTYTLAFTKTCNDEYQTTSGLGWQSTTPLDLSGYSEIIVNYSSLGTDIQNIQLYVVDSSNYGTTASGSDGTINYVFSEHTSGWGFGWSGNGNIDYSSIAYLMIHVTAYSFSSASVTIDSIQLVKASSSSSGEGEGEGEGEGGEDDNSGSNSGGTEDNSTYEAKWNLSTGDADFTDVETNDYSTIYKIDGDGTDSGQHNTLVFPNGMSGTYWVALHNVTINTSGRTTTTESDSKGLHRAGAYFTEVGGSEERADSCGIYIPSSTEDNPLTINMVIDGHSTIDASKYGIYVGENSQLNIIYIDDQISDYTQNSKDPDTYTLTIGGSSNLTYGIYNEGKHMFIHTVHANNTSQEDNNVLVGTTTITATDCGIYSYNGVDIKGTYMVITVTGGGEVESTIPTETTYTDYYPGYSITKLVCGIYIAGKGGESHGAIISMIDLTITAKGNQTYGIFLDLNGTSENDNNNPDCYFGFGSVTITATQCVLHHESQYNGYIQSGEKLILILNGPFCEHVSLYYSWYCDGLLADSTSSNSDLTYIIIDGDDLDGWYNDYNIHTQTVVSEVEYVGRNLYAGWNTLCLPYKYKVKSTTDVDDDLYSGYKEGRDVIKKYAIYNSENNDTYDTATNTVTFTILDPDKDNDSACEEGTGLVLQPDVAYLVYLPDTQKNYYEKTKFTAMSTNLEVVGNKSGETEIFFDPCYDKETMSGTNLDGDSDSNHVHYKLTAHNIYTINGTETIDENDTYINDNTYDYVGVANYFNQAPNEGITFPAYRCYIDVSVVGGDDDDNAKQLTIAFDDGSETTGIDQLNGGTLNAIDGNAVVSVYGLNGQLVKVSSAKTATNGLAKGVYVVGGKKVVVM
ncbi:MAG: hypothetical protein LUC49_03055 [Prevotella sp.]|nr:hypothetical protein [Prevotella sp.]